MTLLDTPSSTKPNLYDQDAQGTSVGIPRSSQRLVVCTSLQHCPIRNEPLASLDAWALGQQGCVVGFGWCSGKAKGLVAEW